MGGTSSYRSRFMGLPGCEQPGFASDAGNGANKDKFLGLVNIANTCYANSVLQALYFCNPFRRAVLRHFCEDREADDDSLLTSLAELFAQIESSKRSVGCLAPRRFLSKLRKTNELFCTTEHQDAHEFMEFLLNDIVEHLTKKSKQQKEKERQLQQQSGTPSDATRRAISNGLLSPGSLSNTGSVVEEEHRTFVHDIFQGYLVNQIKCRCCESVTVRRENFLDLSVDIERHTSTAACLRAFESTELLRAENKFFCDTCGCLQEAEKRLRVYQLPSVLTLHLKRFKYVERLGRCCRLSYRVVFPLQLQVVEHHPERRRRPRGVGSFESSANKHSGTTSSPASASAAPSSPAGGGGDQAPLPSRKYELRSVVVHIGRDLSRGHYVTVVRSGDRCVLLDDDVVRVVDPSVFRSFYGGAGETGANGELGARRGGDWQPSRSSAPTFHERSPAGTCCGYLLFYEAVDGIPPDVDRSATLDISAASEWVSEDCNHMYSDSGESDDEKRGGSNNGQPRTSVNPEEAELTQVFEQRCMPGRSQSGRPVGPLEGRGAGSSAGSAT